MTGIIRIAISASEPLFEKGLESIFQAYKDFDPVFLSSSPAKHLGELALLNNYDLKVQFYHNV